MTILIDNFVGYETRCSCEERRYSTGFTKEEVESIAKRHKLKYESLDTIFESEDWCGRAHIFIGDEKINRVQCQDCGKIVYGNKLP